MDAIMMLTDLPTLLSSSHTCPSHASFRDIPWEHSIPNYGRKYGADDFRTSTAQEGTAKKQLEEPSTFEAQPNGKRKSRICLQDLPEEIQQGVLDMLMGTLSSTSSSAAVKSQGMRNWSTAMRHPRGKNMSDLALVSRSWCRMIQERLYRHVKIKGTKAGLAETAEWFLLHPNLQEYVRHIEIWVPVWERRTGQPSLVEMTGSMTFEQHERTQTLSTIVLTNMRTTQEVENINQAYQLASSNATLDEIFGAVSCLFPSALILTIEGGHCKKPPMIRQFRHPTPGKPGKLPSLPGIRTLVLKGAWNIMREDDHFSTLITALPNIREWHTIYAKPKTKAYAFMCTTIRHIPSTLTHLNICLEGFYSKDFPSPQKMRQLQLSHHLCRDLSRILPQLEALTFTGRVCGLLFTSLGAGANEKIRRSRLKSLDLIVKNTCRPDPSLTNDTTGIHNYAFILTFEALVLSATNALSRLSALDFLRIRFIDLDSPCPLLNPYFQLKENRCSGIWSDEILAAVSKGRPEARWGSLGEEVGVGRDKDGRVCVGWPVRRPGAIRVSAYRAFGEGIGGQPQ